MNRATQLLAEQITASLDEVLETEFTFIRADELAREVAPLARAEQDFLLTWIRRVATANIQLAYQFGVKAVDQLERMSPELIEAWALHAMDTYDRAGQRPALSVINELDAFLEHSHARTAGAVLEEYERVLQRFVHGLSGRRLHLAEADDIYTDTETLYLQPLVARLPDKADNFTIYKITVAFLWAQVRFGTFRAPVQAVAQEYADAERFLALFHQLEAVRLEACLARELPGLYRDMQRIKRLLDEPPPDEQWRALAAELSAPGCDVDRVIELARQCYPRDMRVTSSVLHGSLKPDLAAECMSQRIEREKILLRVKLAKLLEEQERKRKDSGDEAKKFALKPDESEKETMDGFELTLDDAPVAPPEDVKALISSIQLDLREIPDDYLVPAGPGEYDPSLFEEKEVDPDDVWKGAYHEEGAFLYDEWDFGRQNYRKNWCAVREKDVAPVYDPFVVNTLEKYSGVVKHLRKTFEAMRDEDRLLKRQTDGDGVDIDALVEALADARDGREMSDRLFTRMHRSDRNIAVMFMVDMSGSTRGWINEAEREALALLCEALETLGDRYAIYGFSGMSRKRCEIFRVKTFAEQYSAEIKARISGIKPQDYTRMGFAIRHLSAILNEVDARTRVLITISDGKPDDFSDYRGEYGIEDTRRALIEARRNGIHPYCITIDEKAHDYLPHMYGAAAYTVIDDVAQLPYKVSDIYRRLTT